MPIHDWTQVGDEVFSTFHGTWIADLYRFLNKGVLPDGYYAASERHEFGFRPDVLAFKILDATNGSAERESAGGTVVLTASPRIVPVGEFDPTLRPRRRYIAVREGESRRLVAVIEIVSAGNKSSQNGLRDFVRKSAEFLDRGVHLLVVDLHPPGPRDPHGLHNCIWREFSEDNPILPNEHPCMFSSFDANPEKFAVYVTTAKVGDPMPTVPLFLAPGRYVEVNLEPTYMTAFEGLSIYDRHPLESS